MANDIIPYKDIEQMAVTIAKSKLFGAKTAEEAIALMLLAQAEGMHPMKAVQDYDIIQGRPAKKARAMLASFQASGGKVEWIERTDEACEAKFSHPNAPNPVNVRWDMSRAQKAGLSGKDNWKKFSRQMLSARVISEGVTCTYPGATGGLYTPEEVQDFDAPKARDMGAAEVVSATESLKDRLRAKQDAAAEAPQPEAPDDVPPVDNQPPATIEKLPLTEIRHQFDACQSEADVKTITKGLKGRVADADRQAAINIREDRIEALRKAIG